MTHTTPSQKATGLYFKYKLTGKNLELISLYGSIGRFRKVDENCIPLKRLKVGSKIHFEIDTCVCSLNNVEVR